MTLRFIVGMLLAFLVVANFAIDVRAADGDGLSITPLRKELKVSPGGSIGGEIIVGNPSSQDINVRLEAKPFSVTDFTYDYTFGDNQAKNWVKFDQGSISLRPGESRKVRYVIKVPESATPGGHYFSLFASTTILGDGVPSTVQAVSLVYLTVNGDLVRTSVMENVSYSFFITSNEIPYSFDVRNTGNVHFGAYFYGEVESLFFGKQPEFGVSHLLMPGATRTIKGAVPAPFLPGIYKVEYGYKVDFADIITTQTGYILFVPPWSVVALIFLALLGRWAWQKRKPQPRSEA